MEYPKMLCRDGQEVDVNGIKVDTFIVDNADDETTARRDGWCEFGELGGDVPDRPRRGRPPKS